MYEASRFRAMAKRAFPAFLVCVSLFLVAAISIREGKRPQPPPSFPSASAPSGNFEGGSGTRVCGSNSLYMLLGVYGVPLDHEQLHATVPVNRDGTSLTELRDAAAALGLETTVRRCSIEELQRHYQSPFIAHLAMVTPHYAVVIDISDESLTFLDGTTGKLETLRRAWIEERWSGYVLLPQTSATIHPILFGASMFNWLVVAFLVTRQIRDSRKRPQISIAPVASTR